MADDLTPSDAIRLGRERVIGFAIETGGRTSHTTIIARSLNIPAVAGLVGVTGKLTDEAPVIVDGETGRGHPPPRPRRSLGQYMRRKAEIERRDRDLLSTRELAAVTRDGVRVELMANIDLPEEVEEVAPSAPRASASTAASSSTSRRARSMPTEEEHYRDLSPAGRGGGAATRRSSAPIDLGGRKLAREMMATEEENPVLGLRGIRLTLARPEVFRSQIRALYRAGLYGDLWVMLPMVSTVEEVRQFRAFADEVMARWSRKGCRSAATSGWG